MDVFDHLIADVSVTGAIPAVPRGAKIKVEKKNFKKYYVYQFIHSPRWRTTTSSSAEPDLGSSVPRQNICTEIRVRSENLAAAQ